MNRQSIGADGVVLQIPNLYFDECGIAEGHEAAFVFEVDEDMRFGRNNIPVEDMNTIEGDIQQWIVIIRPHIEVFEQILLKWYCSGLYRIRITSTKIVLAPGSCGYRSSG